MELQEIIIMILGAIWLIVILFCLLWAFLFSPIIRNELLSRIDEGQDEIIELLEKLVEKKDVTNN